MFLFLSSHAENIFHLVSANRFSKNCQYVFQPALSQQFWGLETEMQGKLERKIGLYGFFNYHSSANKAKIIGIQHPNYFRSSHPHSGDKSHLLSRVLNLMLLKFHTGTIFLIALHISLPPFPYKSDCP